MSTTDIIQFAVLFLLVSYVLLHHWLLSQIGDILRTYIAFRTAMLVDNPSTPPHPSQDVNSDEDCAP